MTSLPLATSLRDVAAERLRGFVIYVLPALVVLCVVLTGLWVVPDNFAGMYGNYDGHWASWVNRGILEWGGFLDFSPLSPLSGTGSPFLPYLPWLNPGALVLAIPGPLPLRHLASMLLYLTELSASLYLLYRHLEFSREQSFLATLLYICIFFIPFSSVTRALPWYALAPVNAHLIAAMNVATIALIRTGNEQLASRLFFGFLFFAALFVAFASTPITSLTYVPVYAVLWIAFLIPFQAQYRVAQWRWGAIGFAVLAFALIGAPSYLAAIAMTAARGDAAPSIFHPGWRLLSPSYWQQLLSALPLCSNHMQLMCRSEFIGWFEMVVLAGGICLVLVGSGVKRRYGLVIIALLALLHFYALLHTGLVLGRLHLVSTPFLMWAFFPLAPPAAIAAGGFVASRILGRRAAGSAWMPAAASWGIAVVAVFMWIQLIAPYQPPMPGRGPLGLPPIAHVPAERGAIVEFLQQRIGLKPGGEFRGYAGTFLGAADGLVRKETETAADTMTWGAYVAARNILFDRFGNSFQTMDLWNNSIPTIEEHGQSVSRQMYYFNRDLLAQPWDRMDPLPASILLYRFRALLLRALGVRFVIADGTLVDPSIERVMTQPGKAGAVVNLYEIKGANLAQFSPTQVVWAADYSSAVRILAEQTDLENRVVLLGAPERHSELVRLSRSRLVVLRDGYRLTAAARGTAMLLLPVQFSHCWRLENADNTDLPRIFRSNIVQTGVLFRGSVDVRLRFDFEPWRASCRLQDAGDLAQFGFK